MNKTQNREIQTAKYDIGDLLKRLAPKSLFVLAGYLSGLATLPYGAAPFGIALLSAADRNSPFIYVGLVISAFTGSDELYALIAFCVYTTILLLRILVRLTLDSPYRRADGKRTIGELMGILFSEAPVYRVLCSALGAFTIGACLLISGGFLYYDLFGLCIATFAAPLSAFVFSLYFTKNGLWRETALLAICTLCVYGASDIKLYGASISVVIAMTVTLFVSERAGLFKGMLTGLTLGLVYSPLLSPAFVLCAVCIGVFVKISPALAYFSALAASLGWGFYTRGIYALDGFFAAVISSCLLYSVAHRLWFSNIDDKKDTTLSTVRCRVLDDSELDGVKLFDINERMNAITAGLEELSCFFEELRLRFPSTSELRDICEQAFESSCSGCPSYHECRECVCLKNEIERLSLILNKDRGLSYRDIDGKLISLCSRLPDILDEINYNSGVRIKNYADGDSSIPDYTVLSRLLEKSMEGESDEYTADRTHSLKLCESLEALNAGIEGAVLYGKRRRKVYIKAKEQASLEAATDRIFDTLSKVLPFTPDRNTITVRKCAGGAALSVSETERMSVELVSKQKTAKKESNFCGDSLCAFKNRDARFFSLISDGMGSGREASAVSEICARFMKSMLSVGSVNSELLELLNGLLCTRGDRSLYECSTTLDLMELDLISGRAEFFKSGAAPTYVFRDGSLFKLRSQTVPIGILQHTDTKRFDFELNAGDTIVMMSDGVTCGNDECPWLFDLLRQNIGSAGLERTADLILKYAVGHGSDDDISIIILKINESSAVR